MSERSGEVEGAAGSRGRRSWTWKETGFGQWKW